MHGFSNFSISSNDFQLVEDGIEIAYGKMGHVFKNGLEGVDVVSYDSKFFYIWSRKSYSGSEKIKDSVEEFKIYRLPHKEKVPKSTYEMLRFGVPGIKLGEKTYDKLPAKINIQAAPASVRLKLRAQRLEKPTKERVYYEEKHYVPIVVHEFGHFYYAKNFSYPYLNQLLELTGHLFDELTQQNEALSVQPDTLLAPLDYHALTELYASLVEIEATKIYAPDILSKVLEIMKQYAAGLLKKGREHPLPTRLATSPVLYAKILAPYFFQNIPDWPARFFKN